MVMRSKGMSDYGYLKMLVININLSFIKTVQMY